MSSDIFTQLVHTLQLAIITSLIFLAGLSFCLSTWVIPNAQALAPKLAASQFISTFNRGRTYLLPSSRTLGALLLLNTILTSQLPNPSDAAKWKHWAVCCVVLISVAPYEILTIFPINDRVEEIAHELERGVRAEEEVKREVKVLMRQWQLRNLGRVAAPLVAGVVALFSVASGSG